MTTLTRAQLAALTTLHRDGRLFRRGYNEGRFARGTVEALCSAGLARPAGGTSPDAVRPAARTWADGYGNWHVIVPGGIGNPEAVARAIVRGETAARAGGVPRWRIALLGGHADPTGARHFREAP